MARRSQWETSDHLNQRTRREFSICEAAEYAGVLPHGHNTPAPPCQNTISPVIGAFRINPSAQWRRFYFDLIVAACSARFFCHASFEGLGFYSISSSLGTFQSEAA